MPDVIDLITQDHREVEDLFSQFNSSQDRSVADTICEELDRHSTGEEQAVYPVARESIPGGAELISEAEEEHGEAKQLIGRIKRTEQPEHLVELMSELEVAIQHHVQEEETELLPKLRESMDNQRREEMGEEFSSAKARASV